KENYDDFYYGKGSTYPDINGAIGILFEQASSRGHLQETQNGLLSFPFTIKNQFTTTLSTLDGAVALRKEFLQWQRDFYKSAITESNASPVKAYVFGDEKDHAKTYEFIEMLLRHQVEVYELKNELTTGATTFKKENSFVVPSAQPQWRLIKTIFEKTLDYKDSLFYDITAWTMPLAFGLPYAEINASQLKSAGLGNRLTTAPEGHGELHGAIGNADYAYLFEWDQLYAPAVLYELQNAGLLVKGAMNKFEISVEGSSRNFNAGTMMIPVQLQTIPSDQLRKMLSQVAAKYGISIYALQSGNVISGTDLGSNKFPVVSMPRIAMITGAGVNALDAGEVWHLLDQRMNIPATHLEPSVFNRMDLNRYNIIIMVGGSYPEINKDKLKAWVQSGGVLVLTEEAVSWASQNGINSVILKKTRSISDSLQQLNYEDIDQVDGAQKMNGAIFSAETDLTHPLAFGYNKNTVSLFKANKVYMEKSKNPYATPFYYGSTPLQSGWVSKANGEAIKNSAAVIVNTVGSGRVINIADNPNFRAFWLGGTRLFMNAIFFGRNINAASGRINPQTGPQ
ncbi:MAG: zinc carboxypeptidase, partial [Chitinophagaceae bacterium]